MKLTKEQIENISSAIDSEGFEYYFCDYGPDALLMIIISEEIKNFQRSRNFLLQALRNLGIEVE